MAEVADQAVGDVDRARRQAAQREAERDARLRPLHRAAHLRERRSPSSATVPRNASSARRASPSVPLTHRSSPGRAPERSSAAAGGTSPKTVMQIVSGPRVVSPPISSQPCASASANRPAREAGEKDLVGARQRERERERERLGAAGGEVAQVDRERLVAEPVGRDGRQEVAALDQHVGETGELHAGVGCDQRAVVADAERGAARGPREEALDELEFAEGGHGRGRLWASPSPAAARPGEHPVRRAGASLQ